MVTAWVLTSHACLWLHSGSHIQHLQSSSVALGQGINIPDHHSTWDLKMSINAILWLSRGGCQDIPSCFDLFASSSCHPVIARLLLILITFLRNKNWVATLAWDGLVSANKCQCVLSVIFILTDPITLRAREGRREGRSGPEQPPATARPRTQKLVLVVVKVSAIPRWFYYNITHNDKPCQ